MKMVESDIHVIDTDKYYARLHKKIHDWMLDPSPLVADTALLFEDFPPEKNEVHRSLYAETTANIEQLTKQALSIFMHNMLVCVSRQVADHLPGGRFYNADEKNRQDSVTCPKDNLSAEQVFSGLDRLQRIMPNANTVAFEGILLWSLKKTRDYLNGMDEHQQAQTNFLKTARSQRSAYLELYRKRSASIKKEIADRMMQNREKKAAKQRQLTQQATNNTTQCFRCLWQDLYI